jgi:hypothetical protein
MLVSEENLVKQKALTVIPEREREISLPPILHVPPVLQQTDF